MVENNNKQKRKKNKKKTQIIQKFTEYIISATIFNFKLPTALID